MTNSNNNPVKYNIAQILLLLAGIIFLLSVLCYNEFSLAFLVDPDLAYKKLKLAKIRTSVGYLIGFGLAFILISEAVRRISWLKTIFNKPILTNLLLSFLVIFVPLIILEFALKPFANPTQNTTIFLRDEDIGWILKPNIEDTWGGVQITTNGKGLRGPERDYVKPPNVKRVLFLGDSVTFGYKLEHYEQTYAHHVSRMLDDVLPVEVQEINAGVGGYSPWQEYIYLKNEGIKYDPDLVIISFILNDVTEKFDLAKFGGTGEGFQIDHTAFSLIEILANKVSIIYFAKRLGTYLRFGEDIQRGAIEYEILSVKELVNNPDSPDIQHAWQITLENVVKIIQFCRERDIEVMLVAFPYEFQFEDIEVLSIPQKRLSQFAVEHDLPFLDLLPALAERMESEHKNPSDYFVDENHLSPLGNEMSSEIMVDFIQTYQEDDN
ncbi:MAG: hypothetical protein B6242_08955 [Anaerolineaceae bacterium 4572_78]|nr:MAG: hypothetical protein B6242_08955 [Anaerolineaceae bacterium 4572_78]